MVEDSKKIILGGEIWGIRCLIDGLRTDLEALRSDGFKGGVDAVHDNALELAKVLDFAALRLRSAVGELHLNVFNGHDFPDEVKITKDRK
jgi:hypothetical protein